MVQRDHTILIDRCRAEASHVLRRRPEANVALAGYKGFEGYTGGYGETPLMIAVAMKVHNAVAELIARGGGCSH